MFKPVNLSGFSGREFVPQAIVDRPISYLAKNLNITVARGQDDFDEYEGAAIQINDGLIFEIKHYAGYPDNSTTIYLPYEIEELEQISALIRIIMEELGIPRSWIIWQRSDDPEL